MYFDYATIDHFVLAIGPATEANAESFHIKICFNSLGTP